MSTQEHEKLVKKQIKAYKSLINEANRKIKECQKNLITYKKLKNHEI